MWSSMGSQLVQPRVGRLHQVSLAGSRVRLASTEYRLLFELSANAWRVLIDDQPLRQVCGQGGGRPAGPP